jgi:peptide/nickel transport system permease protein
VQRASIYIKDPKQIAAIPEVIEKYHLNAPIHVQYYYWIIEVFQGNLGWSKSVSMRVSDAIRQYFPATFELVLWSAPVILFLGIRLGVSSAVHKDKAIDHATRTSSILGWSLPSFWIGILLLAIFYGQYRWFPPERLSVTAKIFVTSETFVRYTSVNTIDAILNWQPWIFVDALRHLVLPVISLTIQIVALIVRIMRSSMLEALGKGYIITARAKGLDQSQVINKHAKRNAMIPVFTVSGLLLAGMVTGVVVTETIFEHKGIGWWAARAAATLDIPAVLAFALLAGVIFVVVNLVVDILYARIDPRIQLR